MLDKPEKVICQTCNAMFDGRPHLLDDLDQILCFYCKTYSLLTLADWTKEKNKEYGTDYTVNEVQRTVGEMTKGVRSYKDFNDDPPSVDKYVKVYGETFRDFIQEALEFRESQVANSAIDFTPQEVDLYIENVFAISSYDPETGVEWNGEKYYWRF
jgi:hypothetical protein